MCLCIRSAEITLITSQNAERNRLSVNHVTKIPQNYTCTLRRQLSALYWAYVGLYAMPNQRINTTQKTLSKILPSPTYMEITKNSI